MSLRQQPRTVCSVVALLVGLFGLGLVPRASWLERWDRGVAASWLGLDAERQLSGEGSYERERRQIELSGKAEPGVVRLVVVDDDPEGFFEASPPPPADMGVIAMNLRKLGVRHLGYPQPLSWDEPDPIALQGLRRFWDGMDSVTFGYPLAFGAGEDPVASPFLRMSLPVRRVEGEIRKLPVVNRLAVPLAELGGERSVAGFSVLLNEGEDPKWEPMLARWGDRVVFSFALASELASSGVAVEEVKVTLGEEIRLGKAGKRIPIDEMGRVMREARGKAMAVPAAMVASELDRVLPEGFEAVEGPVWITDQRSVVSSSVEARWRDRLGALHGTLDVAPVLQTVRVFRRPEAVLELGMMMAWALGLGFWLGSGRRWLAWVKAAAAWAAAWQGGVMAAQAGWLAVPFAWLAVPVVVAVLRPFLAVAPLREGAVSKKPKKEVEAIEATEAVAEEEQQAEEAIPAEPAVEKSVQKGAAKKAPAKKAAVKRPAKKAAKKAARKSGKKRSGGEG